MYGTCYSSPILMKHENSENIFEKYPTIEFHEKSVQMGAELLHADRRKDRHDETKLKVAFHNFSSSPNKRRTSVRSVRFQPPIPVIKRLQTHASHRAATGSASFIV
jgi:hypothetical protein